MDIVVREWRDLWCNYHSHLESDYECNLMRFPFDHSEGLAEQVFPVTVTRTIKVDDE